MAQSAHKVIQFPGRGTSRPARHSVSSPPSPILGEGRGEGSGQGEGNLILLPPPVYKPPENEVAELLEKWPNIEEASREVLALLFREERIRLSVATISAAAIASSFQDRWVKDPSLDHKNKVVVECFHRLGEDGLMRIFRSEDRLAVYREYLETRVRNELANAGFAVPSPYKDAAELTTTPDVPEVVSDEEWRAIQIWMRYLWYLIAPQVRK